jgi:phenylalanyl-tRNA synthetase beta chain
MVISGLLTGSVFTEQWGAASKSVDFYDIKNDIVSLINLTGKKDDFSFVAQTHPALHPGQSCAIYVDKELIGYCGALHPAIAKTLGLTETVYLFECLLKYLTVVELPQFRPISKFPTIRRDIAFIVDQEITSQQLQDLIKLSAGDLLVSLQLFDVYQGKNIATGKKSVALGLIFQCADRTLIESEVNERVERVITALKQQFNVILRD